MERPIPWWRRWRTLVLEAFLLVVVVLGTSEVLRIETAFHEAERAAIQRQADTARALASATRLFVERYQSIAEQAAMVLFEPSVPRAARLAILNALPAIHPDIGGAVITDPSGRIVASPNAEQVGVDLSDETYFQVLRAGDRVVVSDLVQSTIAGRPATPVAAVGRDREGRFLGAVVIGLPAERLRERLAIDLAGGAYPIVLDRSGRVVVHGERPDLAWKDRDFAGLPYVLAALAGQPSAGRGLEDPATGADRIGAVVPVPDLGWAVGVLQPTDAALAPALAERRTALLQVAVVLVVAVALAFALGLWLSAPIAALSAGVAAVARGDLSHRVPVRGPGEVARLAADFNSMGEALLAANEELKANAAQMEESLGELEVVNQSLDEALVQAQTDRQRLEATLDSLPDAALVVDAKGRVVIANTPARRLLGDCYRPGFDIYAPERPPVVPHFLAGQPVPTDELPIRRALRRGERTLDLRLAILTPAGEMRQVVVSAVPTVASDGRLLGAVTVLRDVTEAHLLETLKDQFIARASHELRTPVTAIRGTLRFLGHVLAGRSAERPEELLAIAQRNVEHMIRLIDDLLDASRLQTGQVVLVPEPIRLAELVDQVIQQLVPAARERGVALRAEVAPDLTLDADALKLEQVLANLVGNAVKFTPDEGSVTIEARGSADEVEIRVRDTGVGLAAEHLPRVFEPFFQVGLPVRRSRGPGAGLGLTIAKGLVERHGGRIWVESEGPGRGTAVVVVLPRRPSH